MGSFKDSFFTISEKVLSNPGKKWAVNDFPNLNRNEVSMFYNLLLKEGVGERKSQFGKNSALRIIHPARLLELCIENFSAGKKSYNFISNEKESTVLRSIKNAAGTLIIGGLKGLRPELKYSEDGKLILYINESRFFKRAQLNYFQVSSGIYHVKFGGGIYLVLPAHKQFLNSGLMNRGEYKIPSDFYSYLSLCVDKNPINLPQKEHMEQLLRRHDGNFLSWNK